MPPVALAVSDRPYSTDADGGAPVAVRMEISGSLGADYLGFVVDRAAWLSLSGSVSQTAGKAVVVAAGPEALVGALEMACTLGPIDAIIRAVELTDLHSVVPPGFIVHS